VECRYMWSADNRWSADICGVQIIGGVQIYVECR